MAAFWPQPLVDDLCERRAIVVLGAGVSKHAVSSVGDQRNPPLWKEFLETAVERYRISGRHIKKAIKEGDYLNACEWIKAEIDEGWIPFLKDEFVSPSYQPSSIHDKIFRLDQRVTFSLNFDSIYETFVLHQTSGRTLVKQYHDEDVYKFLRDRDDYIVKIHGSIGSPDFLIFSESDYARARARYAVFYEVLDASILSHTFMFIGCGLRDPNITLLLESQNFRFPQAQPHYLLTGSKINSDLENSLRRNRNLKCIKYDPAGNHTKLGDLLDGLLKEVEAKRAVGV